MRTQSAARHRAAMILIASGAVVGTLAACTSSQGQAAQPSTAARIAPAPTTTLPSVPTPMPSHTEKPVPVATTTAPAPAPKAQRHESHESPNVERPTAAHVRDDCVDLENRPAACTDLRPVRLNFAVRPSHVQPGQRVTVEGAATLYGGAPAVGARVNVYRSPMPRVESSEIRLASGRTDASGHVSLQVVAPKHVGDWPLLVEAESPTPRFGAGYESLLLTVEAGSPAPTPIVPAPTVRLTCTAEPVQVFHYAPVSCTVRTQSGKPLADEPVFVERAPGMFVALGSGTTDKNGLVTGLVYDIDTSRVGDQTFGVVVRPREPQYDWVKVLVTRTCYGTATYWQAVTATATPSTIDAGGRTNINVTVTRRFDGKARVDGPVELHDTATGSLVATAITGADGTASFTVSPATTATYDVVAPGTPDLAYGRGSTQVTVTVNPPAVPEPPTITGLSQSLAVPGDTLTVTGQHLADTTGVAFGSTTASGFTVVSDTQIQAVTPRTNLVGPVHLSVATPAGTSTASLTLSRHVQLLNGSFSPPSFSGEPWSWSVLSDPDGETPDSNTGTWSEVTGLSDLGFSIDASGKITGTPDSSSVGVHAIVVRYTDTWGLTTDLPIQVDIQEPITPTWDPNVELGLPGACPGRPYELSLSQFLTAYNPVLSGTYSIVRGTLPAGFKLDAATAVLSGATAVASTSPITLRYTQSDGLYADVDTIFAVATMFC